VNHQAANRQTTATPSEAPAGQGATLEYAGVAKHYGNLTALHPTDLKIAAGEFFALIGPSGSGKTTLLGVTAGFVAPDTGQVLVNGRDIVGQPPYRRDVGMVFQNYALFPHMTVAQNVGFPLRMRRMAKPQISERVRDALAMVRLDGFAERMPAQLSGGQQQRVALARAAIYRPGLLLMDEPLGALDKNLREEMQDEIRRLQRELGATVLYVTHDQQEASTMADRIAILRGGRIEQIGPPRAVYERPTNRFVASFLGEANLLTIAASVTTPSGAELRTACGLQIAADSQAAAGSVLCLRPENIRLGEAASGCDNCMRATVLDAVHIAGSIRYRLELPGGSVVLARSPARLGDPSWPAGGQVQLGWRVMDAAILPD
jgi:putative spermidine/putrescine transport system ATP-binding protein